MLTAESSGTVLANVIPVVAPPTASKSGGTVGTRRQQSVARAVASRNGRCLRKGRQYSVKTFVSLAGLVALLSACPEKPVDTEQEFKKVIDVAPRDPSGYANLGLTYLRMGPSRYQDAAAALTRARKL